ncbi:hypothetical protein [Paracoccus mutanolyticus]|uniref:hypothetical protein n=1 Tax=Paracoccus mutanolyticus TaxID=1499308 RepID=UPI0011AE9B10|nr:hypothetical protein [Paracoccus mutanolyticus]
MSALLLFRWPRMPVWVAAERLGQPCGTGLYIRLDDDDGLNNPGTIEIPAAGGIAPGTTHIAFTVTASGATKTFFGFLPTYRLTEMGMEESASFLADSIALFAYMFLIFLPNGLSGVMERSGARRR